jgi:hypothetical protein
MMKQRHDALIDAELARLHDSYIWHVNAAVTAGHDDLARDLAEELPDEALDLSSATGRAGAG